ncbi:MAG: glycosyltransferase, partial [Terriglobales bacterium]
LLYVGRFVGDKGVFDLLHAYAKLPEETRRAVGLVLAGDGGEREELIRRSRLIHPGRVCFPGFVQRDQLAGFYALAEALVFPTHSDPWGLVVNEAIACGLPVIATEVAGSTADLVRDGVNGYVVAARQPEALSRAMEKLLHDPELRQRMGQMSLQTNSAFTPQGWAAGVARAVTGRSGACRG